MMQEVELARTTSPPTSGSSPENILVFSSRFSGTHSCVGNVNVSRF